MRKEPAPHLSNALGYRLTDERSLDIILRLTRPEYGVLVLDRPDCQSESVTLTKEEALGLLSILQGWKEILEKLL